MGTRTKLGFPYLEREGNIFGAGVSNDCLVTDLELEWFLILHRCIITHLLCTGLCTYYAPWKTRCNYFQFKDGRLHCSLVDSALNTSEELLLDIDLSSFRVFLGVMLDFCFCFCFIYELGGGVAGR